jgi:aryl-alcohol dehydrogenase-like predicted oxidoreductase
MYILHRDDPDYPVGPLVEAFNHHIEEGRIGSWGVSNWTYQRVKAANEYAKKHSLLPCSAVSTHYSLAIQFVKPWGGCPFGDEGVSETITGDDMADAREWYAETQIPFFAYSPLSRGLFSGRCSREAFTNNPAVVDEAAGKAYCHEENFKRLDRVEILAKEKGRSVASIALAWLLHQPLNIFLLIGANSGQEYLDDSAAFEIKLTPEEINWLDLRSETR